MTKYQNEQGVGGRIVDRLKQFVKAVESGEDLKTRFTTREIRFEQEPKEIGSQESKQGE